MMKRIEVLDKAAEVGTKYCDINVNPTFGAAYFYSQEAGNDLINFGEVIWDYDIDEILENCRRFGITEFTISSTFSSLIVTIAELQKKGCKLEGLIEINSRFDDWKSCFEGETKKERIPAFKISLEFLNPECPAGLFGRSNIHNKTHTYLSVLLRRYELI